MPTVHRFKGFANRLATAVALAAAHAVVSAQPSAPVLSSNVPHDADTRGVPNTMPAMQAAFDDFSWRSFVALSWPALADGTPDPNHRIGQGGDAATVFERWPMAEDVFPAPPAVRRTLSPPTGRLGSSVPVSARARAMQQTLYFHIGVPATSTRARGCSPPLHDPDA